MHFKKSIFILVSLILLLFSTRVLAQQEITLSSIEVDIWPEYDQPSALVIYRINIPSQVVLPAEIDLRIPVNSQIHAVAVRQNDGLINTTYTQEASGEWSLVKIQATSPEVHFEYYDPTLTKDGSARHYEYRWPGDYAVDSMVLQVQQPWDATGLTISPSLGAGQAGQDGLKYYTANQGGLVDNQTFTLVIDYQKPTDELSASKVKVQPSSPIEADTPGSFGLTNALPWILGGLGLLLILGGGFWYWQSGRDQPGAGSRRRSHRRGVGEPEVVSAPGGASGGASGGKNIYCHQCGKRAEPGDRFCRTCGTPLRTG